MCLLVKMFKSQIVKMSKCQNAKMQKCKKVQSKKCKNAKCLNVKTSQVFVPSCSLDEFSGTRGPLDENGENRLTSNSLYFHGRHIFNSLLRDLVAKHGIDRAESVILVGSGEAC